MKRNLVFTLTAIVVSMCSVPAMAQELFRDQMTNAAAWGINKGADPDSSATFSYDYSADGIPEAPNSQVGDSATSGVKLEANNGDFTDTGAVFSMYPIGENFTGNHGLRFDAWMNYDAVERNEGASSGTTEFLGGGIGYDNVSPDVGAGAQALATNDGGSGSDWRVFDPTFVAAVDMNAGDRNGAAAYYADFLPGVATPAAQGQVGTSPPQLSMAGSPGFQWITWDISVIDDIVRVAIDKPNGDRLAIDQFDSNVTGAVTAGNISIVYADFFSSVTQRPDLTFGIVDNVVVTAIPEPATLGLLILGGLGVVVRRRR